MIDPVTRGIRVQQFLEDEAIQAVLADLRKENYDLFIASQNEGARQMAQAQALVLLAFEASLRAVVGRGEIEQHEREQREQNATER